MWAIFLARNASSSGTAPPSAGIRLPFLIIVGFGLIFGRQGIQAVQGRGLPVAAGTVNLRETTLRRPFSTTGISFCAVADRGRRRGKLNHHKIDFS